MKPKDKEQVRLNLALHLGIVLVLKFVLLALLWHFLVAPFRIEVDARGMGERLTQGSPPNILKEQAYDRIDRR